jgi:glutamate-1-semialdehyde 2,1-aminomutase
LDALDFEVTRSGGREKVRHQGTFNANPLSAAAGVATLCRIADGKACAAASAYGATLRRRMNEVLEEEKVAWAAYGEFSGFHLFTNPKRRKLRASEFDAFACPHDELRASEAKIVNLFRLAMLNHGVDVTGWPGGTISAVHGDEELERTLEAFRSSLRDLRREGALAGVS